MGTDPHNNPQGDFIHGDKVGGDKVLGNKIMAENVFIQPSERPAIWHGVPDMPTYFLGRTDLINDLAANLTSGNTLALSAEGLPGVGKTALAVALAHDTHVLAHFSDGVLWAGLGTEPDVMGALNGWATALGSDVSQMVTPADRSQAVKNLIGQRRLLLVLDDAWKADAAKLLRCGGPLCTHLLTTRLKDVAQTFAGQTHATVVPELASDPALDLLQAHAPQACAADPDAARKLVTAVGGLPLALELLGGYLGATRRSATPNLSHKALSDMAETENRLALACQRLGDLSGSTVTLNETIALSLEGLDEEPSGADAVAAFYALGAFAPKPADFSWQAACAVADCGEETIAWLLERNLVQQVEAADNLLTLHQSLADVARQQMEPDAPARHQNYYLGIVNENREDWQRITLIYEQIDWIWHSLPDDESVLEFIGALQIYWGRRGLLQDYFAWLKRGLDITVHRDLKKYRAGLLNNIGSVYRDLGEPEEALLFYNKGLPIYREVGYRGGEAATLNNVGEVYRSLGQPEMALQYFTEALFIRWELGDRDEVGTALNNIGMVYEGLGQREEALRYFHEALSIGQAVGDQDGEGTTLNNIGLVYEGLGQPEEAFRYFNEALSIHREAGNRAGEGTALVNIGVVYRKSGQFEEALRYYNEALPIHQETGNRTMAGTTLNNIGLVYDSLGQFEEALQYFNEALPIHREVGNRAMEGTTLNNIGAVYDTMEQLEEALNYYNEALSIHREVGNRVMEGTTLTNIGLIYRGLGQIEKAMRYYNEALLIRHEVGDRREEIVTRYNMFCIYWDQGNINVAHAEMKTVVELAAAVQSPHLARFQEELAQLEAIMAQQ